MGRKNSCSRRGLTRWRRLPPHHVGLDDADVNGDTFISARLHQRDHRPSLWRLLFTRTPHSILLGCLTLIAIVTLTFGIVLHTIYYLERPLKMLPSIRPLMRWAFVVPVAGVQQPRQPKHLPGLRVHPPRNFKPQELLMAFRDVDVVYTFVNGSEMNHVFRNLMINECGVRITAVETFRMRSQPLPLELQDGAWCTGSTLHSAKDAHEVLRRLRELLPFSVSGRDRETDELRHSLRSVEQYMRWHRGRVVMVSPGHHPQWVDAARNFLSGSCGGASAAAARDGGAHLRVTTVHQDAVMPYGMRLTVDSHVIEQHLWRVHNITSVHLYFNDDYFVNRDVAITDLFNEYGGTVVRTESGIVEGARRALQHGESWVDAVAHTNLFNIMELDIHREDHLPLSFLRRWRVASLQSGSVAEGVRDHVNVSERSISPPPQLVTPTDEFLWVALHAAPELLPDRSIAFTYRERYRMLQEGVKGVEWANSQVMRRRHLAAHAPFVYCTNMFRFMSARYEGEFAHNTFHHRSRSAADLLIPFVYNAFIMARPWQASPKFLPYLLNLHDSHAENRPSRGVDIHLDNTDGCAPATQLVGQLAARAVYASFGDDIWENAKTVAHLLDSDALFFNINAGFTSAAAADQLLTFLRDKYPRPMYLEGAPGLAAEADGLRGVYDALMALPVVVLTSFAEGVCPAVRSLQLWLPDHGGAVVAVVQRFGDGGGADPSLASLRKDLRHRVRSAMPAVGCALLSGRVRVTAWDCDRGLADVLREVGPDGASVVLPAGCGGGAGGVRVRGIVADARTTSGTGERNARWLRGAVTVPGQTVALGDFDVVRVGGGDDALLVLSRAAAAAKGVHWIDGASENDLLLSFPLPYAPYENMTAPLRWVV